MTDTVTRLLDYAEGYARTHTYGAASERLTARQALEAELIRLFTPLSDEEIADFLGDEYHNMTESELRYFRLSEKAHGIGGES